MLQMFPQDFQYAIRSLGKSPGFSIVAVMSLMLGIGANTVVFSVINAILIRPLPVLHPKQMFVLSGTNIHRGPSLFPYAFFAEARARKDLFSDAIAMREIAPHFSENGTSEVITGECVSGNYFDTLGILPYAGRLLHARDETAAGADRIVILSYGFWKRRFNGDPRVIGRVIHLNKDAMTVIGISSPNYDSLEAGYSPDVRVPMTMWPRMTGVEPSALSTAQWWTPVVCRLKPTVSKSQAEASLNVLLQNYRREQDKGRAQNFAPAIFNQRLFLDPLGTGFENNLKAAVRQLYFVLAVVVIVLLAACTNLASLLLARAATRQREFAVRLALGATRTRILRQLFTESMLLAGIGGALGFLWAYWGTRLLLAFLPTSELGVVPMHVEPDLRVLMFTASISFASGILFGLTPAVRSMRFELTRQLKGEQPRIPGTAIGWRKPLAGAQVALSSLLLVGAMLFLRSLVNLRSVDTGFNSRNVLQVSFDPPGNYNPERLRALYGNIVSALSVKPGIVSATLARLGPIRGGCWRAAITVADYRPPANDPGPCGDTVGPGYFATLQIPLIRGRDFSSRDTGDSPHAAIVNETFAHYYFGQKSPIGKRISLSYRRSLADFEIVGVAKDSKYRDLREQAQRFWYVPYEQFASIDNLTLFVRTAGDPSRQIETVRRTIRDIDPNVPVYHVRTLDQRIDQLLAADRLLAISATFFGFLAALAVAMGLYGVMTFTVVQRTQEIGVRMALGAERADVLWPVMTELGTSLLAGLAIGLTCALLLGRFVGALLFELKPADPASFLFASLLMGTVAVIAGYVPARRAMRIDPIAALRYQ